MNTQSQDHLEGICSYIYIKPIEKPLRSKREPANLHMQSAILSDDFTVYNKSQCSMIYSTESGECKHWDDAFMYKMFPKSSIDRDVARKLFSTKRKTALISEEKDNLSSSVYTSDSMCGLK